MLPGIEGGDIGTKSAVNEKENGYLRFSNVQVPRISLLARYIDINREGVVTTKGDPRILYSIMLKTRIQFLTSSPMELAQALLIGTRYSVLRRQF